MATLSIWWGDCSSRLAIGGQRRIARSHGNHYGAMFYIAGGLNQTLALLWARENGYWKIVSWRADAADEEAGRSRPPDVAVETIEADVSFADAARAFLDSWLIRKNYDEAFRYLSPASYACYDLVRGADEPAAGSLDEAGRRIRAGLEASGARLGQVSSLDAILTAAPPFHPAIKVMRHEQDSVYALSSIPTAFAEAADCAARARGEELRADVPFEYGKASGLTIRFLTGDGDSPVLRTVWQKESGSWRITAYDVELP